MDSDDIREQAIEIKGLVERIERLASAGATPPDLRSSTRALAEAAQALADATARPWRAPYTRVAR